MYPLYALPSLLPSGFTSDFQFYDCYIIAAYILLYRLYSIPPVSYSYLIIPWVFHAWHHLLYIYLLLYASHDTVFNVCLWFGFIDIRVLIFARHLTLASPLAGEFWLPWILRSRSQRLELVDSPSCWSEWSNRSVDHRQTVQSPFLPVPLLDSRVFFITREHLLYCL